jgi:hypothetical protein
VRLRRLYINNEYETVAINNITELRRKK